MGAISRNLRRLGAAAVDSAGAAATAGLTAAAGSAVAQSMMPEIDMSNTTTTTSPGQYEAQDAETTDVEIGQETSTTERKKKSNRGRTQSSSSMPSIPTSAAPAATSTGLQI